MDKSQQATTERVRDAVRRDVKEFFERQGYRQTGPLRFSRGSLFGSMFGLSPKKWGVKVQVVLKKTEKGGTHAEGRWMVDTSGQIVTETEEQFWHMETEDFVDAVHGRLDEATASDRLDDEARAFSKTVFGWLIGIPVVLIVLAVVFAAFVALFVRR